jgi:ribosomal protein S18 acetylase RimI-like enzyme
MNAPSSPENAVPAQPFFSAVDSTRFGVRIGRVNLASAASVSAAREISRRENLRMLIVRCATDQLALVHELEANGAKLMDTLLYYRRKIGKDELPAELKPNRIRLFRESDQAGIEQVAKEGFAGYQGHYHADPLLDRARADEGYVEWALNCCRARGANSEVLVAEDANGAPCGFFVVRLNSPQEGEGWLAAVSPAAEGRGLYWSLCVYALRWCREHGAGRMICSTQLTNSATQKTYGRLGFDLQSSFYTFHLWLPETKA